MTTDPRRPRIRAWTEGTAVMMGLCCAGTAWGWALDAPRSEPLAFFTELQASASDHRIATAVCFKDCVPAASIDPVVIPEGVLLRRPAPAVEPPAPPSVQPQAPPPTALALAEPHPDHGHAPSTGRPPPTEALPIAMMALPSPTDLEPEPGGPRRMTRVDESPVSTFSLATGNASYELARAELRAGRLPEPSTVQVEDFVNHLRYDYPQPEAQEPVAVDLEATPSPWSRDHHVLRVGVQGRRLQTSERAPLHLTFLVDVSGSMYWPEKIGLAQESLRWLSTELGPEDTLAIATYGGRVEVVLPPSQASEADRIEAAIQALEPGKGPKDNEGLALAYDLAHQTFQPGHQNRVVVVSDGDVAIGDGEESEIRDFVAEHAAQGIALSTLGFGQGTFRDPDMEELARAGHGRYHHIDSLDATRQAFTSSLEAHGTTVARDVAVEIEFAPDSVRAYRLLGYDGELRAPGDAELALARLHSQHQATALYELELHSGVLPADQLLATVRTHTAGDPPGLWQKDHAVSDVVRSPAQASTDLHLAMVAGGFAERLSGRTGDAALDYQQLRQHLARHLRQGEPDDIELLDMVEAAAAIEAQASHGGR